MSSTSNESFTDPTMHSKLKAPRSLHGVEDAEIIWQAITQRFPNAAPLLCEMETVIERAEDLLQQLKIPCTQENVYSDTSGSFHTPDSRESNATISIGSDIESYAEEETNDTACTVTGHHEATDNVEMNQMPHADSVHEVQVDFESEHGSEQSIRCEDEHLDQEYHPSSSPRLDEIVEDFKTNSQDECRNTQGESDVTDSADKGFNATSEERLMAMITKQSSLEGWAKVVDDALREWHDEETVDISNENDSETDIDTDIDNCLLMINNSAKCDETDIHTSDKSNCTKVVTNSIQNSISTSSVIIRNRSPFTILEQYAKRCEVPIKYEYKSKPNFYVINGDLCGFHDARSGKNELATKILWMVAEHQMDGSKLSSSICGLLDLSREEMLEIIAFNKGELKNASQKLYKFCLERGEPTPEYYIRKIKTNQGFMYATQCVALHLVGIGQGLRKDSAKIAAAENLYQQYVHEMEQQT